MEAHVTTRESMGRIQNILLNSFNFSNNVILNSIRFHFIFKIRKETIPKSFNLPLFSQFPTQLSKKWQRQEKRPFPSNSPGEALTLTLVHAAPPTDQAWSIPGIYRLWCPQLIIMTMMMILGDKYDTDCMTDTTLRVSCFVTTCIFTKTLWGRGDYCPRSYRREDWSCYSLQSHP